VREEAGEDGGGDGFFVVGNGEAALGHVEDTLRGAAVALGIVEDALADAVGGEDFALVGILARGEREDAGEAGGVEDKGGGGDGRGFGLTLEVVVEEILNALVDGAEVAGEGAVLFAAEGEEVIDEGGEAVGGAGGERDAGLADFAELQIEVGEELGVGISAGGRGGGGGIRKRHGEGAGGERRRQWWREDVLV
jgi:hypothetical protein